jgi:hypothetical protein
VAIPACEIPALRADATDAELEQRAQELSYDLVRDEGEAGLVANLTNLGAFSQ